MPPPMPRQVIERSRDRGFPIRGGSDRRSVPCILLVDDRPDQRYIRRRALLAADPDGYDIRESATGRGALQLARLSPDLIILDIKLPDLDGFEVCRRLKGDTLTAAIPVLLTTAFYDGEGDRAAGIAAGANEYLNEPIDPAMLVDTVKRLLNLHA